MRSLVVTALTLAIGIVPATAAVKLELSSGVISEINVTSDSSLGWRPTVDQRQRALMTVEAFLDALEAGRYAEAYRLQTDIDKRDQTLAQFTEDARKFRALAGPVKFWRVLKVTWTKDPAHAPFPGIYAAIDLAGQFANVDRDCGYIVLYQPPAGGDFTLMRREHNFIDNATARKIEETKSKEEVTRLWSQLSRNCPNYVSSPDMR